MKNKLKSIVFLTLLVFCFTNSFSQTVVDEVIAIVGKNMIKYSELETTYLQTKSRNITGVTQTRCDLLESMLLNKLLLNQAEVDSIEVTDNEVDNEMNGRIKYMIQVYGSQEAMERQMNKTLPEIREEYKDVIKENLLISQEQNKLLGDVKITPQEVADYYKRIPKDSLPTIDEEYGLTQIVKLPKVTDEEKAAVKERLNGYRERILKGTKFATLAQLYSDDEVSAKKGGELGFFSRGDMVSEFEAVAFSLQPGEISPVFETKYGFHIIQMIERRGDQVNCRHILLQPKVSDAQLYKAKQELDSIRQLITSGKISFEDAIVKYSDDNSKINGGIIVNKNNASSTFTKDAINETIDNLDKVDFASMHQGDISQPVLYKAEFSNAYRLIKIKKKTEKHTINLNEDFDKIQATALGEKKNNILKDWAASRIDKTYIKINPKYKDCKFTLNWLKN